MNELPEDPFGADKWELEWEAVTRERMNEVGLKAEALYEFIIEREREVAIGLLRTLLRFSAFATRVKPPGRRDLVNLGGSTRVWRQKRASRSLVGSKTTLPFAGVRRTL